MICQYGAYFMRKLTLVAVACALLPSAATAQDLGGALDLPCSAQFDPALYPSVNRLVPTEAPPATRSKLRGVIVRTLTWKTGELIKVCFRSGTPAARARVARYASEWMQYANVKLEFGDPANPRTCAGDNHEAIKVDFIDSGPKSGFWSALGTISRKQEHSLNLSFLGRDQLPVDRQGKSMPEAEARRLILHEFGHALGLVHEHQSPNAQCSQDYYEEAVLAYGALRGWPREQTVRNFKRYDASDELNATAVDRQSIMHYSLPPWLFKTGEKSACFVPINFDISAGDKAIIAQFYPRTSMGAGPLAEAPRPNQSLTRSAAAADPKIKLVQDYTDLLKGAGLPQARVDQLVAEFKAGLKN